MNVDRSGYMFYYFFNVKCYILGIPNWDRILTRRSHNLSTAYSDIVRRSLHLFVIYLDNALVGPALTFLASESLGRERPGSLKQA